MNTQVKSRWEKNCIYSRIYSEVTEVAPVVQIVTEEERVYTSNCLEQKAMTKHSMEIGVRLDSKVQRRRQRHRVKETTV